MSNPSVNRTARKLRLRAVRLPPTLDVIMSHFPSLEVEEKTAALIEKRFHVPRGYARRLAVAALEGIDAHGGNSRDWATIEETIKVVVASWIRSGALK